MGEKEQYRQKMKAQFDELMAEVDKLRAKASGASADANLKLAQYVKDLEVRIDEGKAKLAELTDASEDRWDSVKEGFESVWRSLKSAIKDASTKAKK